MAQIKLRLYFYDETGRPISGHLGLEVYVLKTWGWTEIMAYVLSLYPDLQDFAGVVDERLGQVA